MCGICGYINSKEEQADRNMLIRMRDAMHHRGPDDAGLFLDGPVGLGHRRLSIIDLEGGHQPMSNEDDSLILVYNGEIYNFQTLKKDLIDRGHDFRTNSDSEVILHLYEEKGPDSLEYLRGMFAFAIWDRNKDLLFLARDRLGIKPLYYFMNNTVFMFSSEIKSFFQSPGIMPELNEKSLARYLRYRFVYGEETLFKNVHELMPGHYMIIRKSMPEIKQYWDLPVVRDIQRDSHYFRSLVMQELEEAVRLRMISDVPIGVFLSGGIDSSAVAGLMSRNANRVKTFSIGFYPEELNELEYSKAVAKIFNTEHHEYHLDAEDFFVLLKKLIWHHDEPLIFPASIPLYLLSKYSRDSATVMLAGEGSDELFAGYTENVKAYWMNYARKLVPAGILRSLSNIPFASRYKAILKRASLTENEMICSFYRLFTDSQILEIYDWDDESIAYNDTLTDEMGLGRIEGSFLKKLLYFQIKTYLVALLMKQDKMSMAASIETRVPFLDHHLVELAFQIPDNLKIRKNKGKYIFKQACQSLLPENIIYRKKMGFPVPIENWFRVRGNPFIEVLLDESTKRNSFLKYPFIEKTIKEFNRGNNAVTQRIWALLNIELWRREFLES
jgi:asparagine synthase (glutamine-hydrolysing)